MNKFSGFLDAVKMQKCPVIKPLKAEFVRFKNYDNKMNKMIFFSCLTRCSCLSFASQV